eukprot:55330-Prymnesium_polylepis.2
MGSRSSCTSAADFSSLSASDSVEVAAYPANARAGCAHSCEAENAPAEASAVRRDGCIRSAPFTSTMHASDSTRRAASRTRMVAWRIPRRASRSRRRTSSSTCPSKHTTLGWSHWIPLKLYQGLTT